MEILAPVFFGYLVLGCYSSYKYVCCRYSQNVVTTAQVIQYMYL
jgi:hypothetical protein